AEAALREDLLEPRGDRPRVRGGRRRRQAKAARGRRGLRDAVDRDTLAGEQDQLVEAPVGIDLGDRRDPRLALAGRVADPVRAADVAEVAIPAGDVAA